MTPKPTTPATTNRETVNTRIGNRKGNLRRVNKGGAIWLGQNYFKGEMTNLNSIIGLITKRLEQGATYKNLQDVLNNYVLNNFRKAEDIVEIITDLNDPVTNFCTKHMPDDRTEKEEEPKIKMKMWEMQVKYMD